MSTEPILDDERVYRHIPGGTTFQAPGPRITSKNFSLRSARVEKGLSVSRARFTRPVELMARIGNLATGSKIATTTVGDLRAIGYDVIADPIPDDMGHALIVSGTEKVDAHEACRRLANLFQFGDDLT